MRPLRWGLALILGLGLAGFTAAFAQTAPAPQQTCEQKLDQAQDQLLEARKRVAQAEFSSAAIEQIALACQRKASEGAGTPKAQAEQHPTRPPADGPKK